MLLQLLNHSLLKSETMLRGSKRMYDIQELYRFCLLSCANVRARRNRLRKHNWFDMCHRLLHQSYYAMLGLRKFGCCRRLSQSTWFIFFSCNFVLSLKLIPPPFLFSAHVHCGEMEIIQCYITHTNSFLSCFRHVLNF